MDQRIRPVSSLDELARVIGLIWEQVADLVTPEERRFRDVPCYFPLYQDLMLVAETDGQVVGGVIGIGPREGAGSEFSVLVKALGVSETERGRGWGRLLLGQLEARAAAMGAVEIALGAVASARGFYARMGYSGRSRMHKALPGAGVSRYGSAEDRRRRLELIRARRDKRLSR